MRATIAVAALYAFILQAFFTGMLPVGGAQARGLAEICSPYQGDGETPAKHTAKTCCTAACAPLAVPPPAQNAVTFHGPPRIGAIVIHDAALPPPARAPPVHAHSPRGPPTV